MPASRHVLLPLALLLAVSGCAPGKVKVTGTVLQNGKPITVSKTGYVQVTLIPTGSQHVTTLPGRADPEGKFAFDAVTPGKYRIAVQQFDPNPQQDKLRGAFSVESTKIERTIDAKTPPLTIDIAKPEG